MLVEAHKSGDGYVLPLIGKEERIEVIIDEDKYEIDWIKYIKNHSEHTEELKKDEYIKESGEHEYRKYLMLDKASMEQNWEQLVITHEAPNLSDNDRIEEAHAGWNKE